MEEENSSCQLVLRCTRNTAFWHLILGLSQTSIPISSLKFHSSWSTPDHLSLIVTSVLCLWKSSQAGCHLESSLLSVLNWMFFRPQGNRIWYHSYKPVFMPASYYSLLTRGMNSSRGTPDMWTWGLQLLWINSQPSFNDFYCQFVYWIYFFLIFPHFAEIWAQKFFKHQVYHSFISSG